MNKNPSEIDEMLSFQVSQSDMGTLIVDLLKLKPDVRSPLKAVIDDYVSNSVNVGKELEAIAKDKDARKALQILAQPELVVENRNGGGTQVLNYFTACHAPSIDKDAFAVVMPSFEGAFMFLLFDNPWLYLAWWLNLYASNPPEPVANFIPPPVQLEPLVYLLHAIDSYRRCAFVSQLSFAPTDTPSITVEAYSETLKQSVKSADLRWLLPSFLALMPNLDLSKFSEDPAHFEPLAQLDFLLPGKGASGDDGIMGFGEAGRSMGVEFYRGWFQSIGFEISVLADKKWRILQRGFLAPTSLANHLILTEVGRDGAVMFNHQAMSREALEFKLSRMFRDILSFAPDQITALPSGIEQATTSPASLTCALCGEPLPPGAKFCTWCGAPVLQEEKFSPVPQDPIQEVRRCPNCCAELKPGAKFCTQCGTKISLD